MTDKASVDALIDKIKSELNPKVHKISECNIRFTYVDAILDCIAIIYQHFAEQPTTPAQGEVAMQKATEILAHFQQVRKDDSMYDNKLEEWQACYAHLFTQMQPVFEENKRLKAAMQPAPVGEQPDEDVLIAIVKEELFDAGNIEGYDIDRGACNLLKNIKSYLAQSVKPVSLLDCAMALQGNERIKLGADLQAIAKTVLDAAGVKYTAANEGE